MTAWRSRRSCSSKRNLPGPFPEPIRLGLAAIVELSQAQLNLTSAQIANTTARYDYQAQRINVDFQTGVLH